MVFVAIVFWRAEWAEGESGVQTGFLSARGRVSRPDPPHGARTPRPPAAGDGCVTAVRVSSCALLPARLEPGAAPPSRRGECEDAVRRPAGGTPALRRWLGHSVKLRLTGAVAQFRKGRAKGQGGEGFVPETTSSFALFGPSRDLLSGFNPKWTTTFSKGHGIIPEFRMGGYFAVVR